MKREGLAFGDALVVPPNNRPNFIWEINLDFGI
jgi:hypothetical protein